MKKTLSIIVTIILFAFIVMGCGPGPGDWAYELPNGYEVWRVNTQCVRIGIADYDANGKKTDGISHVLPNSGMPESTVVQFCYDDRYVGAQVILREHFYSYYANSYSNRDIPENDENGNPMPRNRSAVPISYYIIDTEENIIYGPYTTSGEYVLELEEMGIERMDWIETYYEPEGAYR
jgi:hypothetical protein